MFVADQTHGKGVEMELWSTKQGSLKSTLGWGADIKSLGSFHQFALDNGSKLTLSLLDVLQGLEDRI